MMMVHVLVPMFVFIASLRVLLALSLEEYGIALSNFLIMMQTFVVILAI